MDRVRIAVIGVGWWGTHGHLLPLSQDPAAEVVAVYSRTAAKAQAQAERYGVPRWYDDAERMLDECALDAVVVATTPNVHYAQAKLALERGLHTLVEKPFVLQAEQARELATLASGRGLLLSVAHPYLFNPTIVRARELVLERAGAIVGVNALFAQRCIDLYRGDSGWLRRPWSGRPGFQPPNATSYSDPAVAGGGEGHTQASHLVGTLLWVTGLRPREVFAYMENADTQVDVIDALSLRFQGGAVGTLMANGFLPDSVHTHDLTVFGQEGVLRLAWDNAGGQAALLVNGACEPITAQGGGATAEVPRNFVRAILGQEELRTPASLAVDEVAILDAAYRSAASGAPARTDA